MHLTDQKPDPDKARSERACVATLGHICLHPDGVIATVPLEALLRHWTGNEKLQDPLPKPSPRRTEQGSTDSRVRQPTHQERCQRRDAHIGVVGGL